jgi:hypothetical protein
METFSSSPIPSGFVRKWRSLFSKSKDADDLERAAFENYKSVWDAESRSLAYMDHADYEKDLGELLQELVDSKKALASEASAFWAMSKIKQEEWATRFSRNPVLVPDEVMEEIDKIYVRHYQEHADNTPDDEFNPLLCLSCQGCSHRATENNGPPICRTTLLNYLEDVQTYLDALPSLDGVDIDDPQRAGVQFAALRVKPLHTPIGVPGRLTLPLASRSMLQDLWTYIMSADGELILEAGRFRFSL